MSARSRSSGWCGSTRPQHGPLRYQRKRAVEAGLRQRLRELAAERERFRKSALRLDAGA